MNTDRLPQPEPFKRIGNLLSCGQNEVGQLGFDEDVIERTRPALVVDAETAKVVDVSAGGMHSKYTRSIRPIKWSFRMNRKIINQKCASVRFIFNCRR